MSLSHYGKVVFFFMSILLSFASLLFSQTGKCGFPEHLQTIAEKSPQSLQKLQLAQDKRNGLMETYLSPSGRFLLHFNTAGIPNYDRNNNGTPDYLEFVANSFDRSWEVEIDSLGFAIPPDSTGAPVSVYDVFCRGLGSGLYGSTQFGFDPIPGSVGRYSSFIEINADFSAINYPGITDPIVRDSMAIAVTAAHEFNHACQLGYHLRVDAFGNFTDLWLLEGSATYMEEVVFSEVNDYLLFYDLIYYENTHKSLFTNSFSDAYIYGEVLLYIMLGEFYNDKAITRKIWENVADETGFSALKNELQAKGSNINAEMQRLAKWMFFVGDNAVTNQFFPDAAQFSGSPNIRTTLVPDINTQSTQSVYADVPLQPASFEYVRIPGAQTGGFVVSIQPDASSEMWDVGHLFLNEPYQIGFPAEVFYNPTNTGSTSGDLILAVNSGDWDDSNPSARINYRINVKFTSSNPGKVYPNPLKPGHPSQMTFRDLPDGTIAIDIYNSSALHIATIIPQGSGKTAYWDLQTKFNEPAGNGVYIYRIVTDGYVQNGKLMIVR